MATIAAMLAMAHKRLAASDTRRLDAEVLLACVLNVDRTYLYTWPEKLLSEDQERSFVELVRRRVNGEPVAYLAGKKEFYSLMLEVNASTLIPRPETEMLVEVALEKLPAFVCRVIDLGTGTGAIALALAKARPQWYVTASDIHPDAVALAKRNAERLQIENVELIQSRWFDQISDRGFDLVISNPPYIDANDPHLLQGDVCFEPRSALVAEKQGLADIEWIARESLSRLKAGGWLMYEHGFEQGSSVRNLLRSLGYGAVETFRDLTGCERVTVGRYLGANVVYG